ncbi:hypothetical protein [Mycobacterium sp. NPDC050041]|uniref:hypothetical protein n=1 Tax=Mycobacterium sp. NPDC050041 TaxID=3364293 RepID=UPI003C3024D6
MNEMDGTREARAEAAPSFDSVERAPLSAESREQGDEVYHGAEANTDRPHLESEVGEAALHGYTDVPGESTESAEAGEARAETDAEGEVYDIWDRRNETSGSINLRNFGR